MAHQRQIIREAIVARLVAANTAAAARVYPDREIPLRRIDLPAVVVYDLSETVDEESRTSAPRYLSRALTVRIVGVLKISDGLEVALDDLALQIERAMHADPTLRTAQGEPLVGDSLLVSTDKAIDAEADRPVGMVRLTYTVWYETAAPDAADVPLDDLTRANIRIRLGGAVHPDNQAVDDVTVPTT